jgi:hypothetical protein
VRCTSKNTKKKKNQQQQPKQKNKTNMQIERDSILSARITAVFLKSI